MKYRGIILLLMAACFGLGLGEIAWAISQNSPDFLWPDWSHQQFYVAGFILGLIWACFQSLAWRLIFHWDFLWGLRIGTASLVPALLGFFWPPIIRFKLPPPHDFPLRNLEILAAAQSIYCLSIALALGILGFWQSRALETWRPKSIALRLGALSLFLYLLTGIWTASWHMTGDAPHYVLLTHSLAYDHDVDLANNYANGDWRRFYDYGDLVAQIPSQGDGRQISEHKPGLPLILAPAYYFLGMNGIRLTLAVLAAFGTSLFFLFCLSLKFPPRTAVLGWALFSFTAPWWTHSQIVLSEMSGALMILCVLAAWQGALPRYWVILACMALPWLNVRFFSVAGILTVMECFGQRKEGKLKILLPLLSFAISFGLALLYNYLEYGSVSPGQTYTQRNSPLSGMINVSMIFRYGCGLLIDQEYGWLPYAPVFALSFLGLWSLALKRDRLFWRLLIPSLIYIGPVACFSWWISGMAPNRYVLPLTAVFAITALEAFRSWGHRPAFILLAILSFGWAICLNVLPWLCWGKQDGQNLFLKILGKALHLNLTAYFPSFLIEKPDSYFWVAGLLVLGILTAWRLGPPRNSNSIS
jgi:hypothetical protein